GGWGGEAGGGRGGGAAGGVARRVAVGAVAGLPESRTGPRGGLSRWLPQPRGACAASPRPQAHSRHRRVDRAAPQRHADRQLRTDRQLDGGRHRARQSHTRLQRQDRARELGGAGADPRLRRGDGILAARRSRRRGNRSLSSLGTTLTRRIRNILFIMCDQLRWDYLSCAGHPTLRTPNIDALAAQGVRFTRAYVQSPVCGASRMSFYTGRYVQSHGAVWNGVPLRVGEITLGDYLRPLGVRTALVGKTHMRADIEGMQRLGIDPNSIIGVRVAECGFDPYERDDGLHGIGPDGRYDPQLPRYNRYLNEIGYEGDNPWHDWANAADGEGNRLASGWAMRHARRSARVREEDSETPYMTRRAMEFMRETGNDPWCLHLSYIKPHWPYIAPAPYNDMFGPDDVS